MSIFDIFSSSPEKKIQSLKKKLQERYGQPESRQAAMDKLLNMGTPEAVAALLTRFKVSVEPSITDAEDKEYLFGTLVSMGKDKVVPSVKEFFARSDDAANWAIRLLAELISEEELVECCIQVLNRVGPDYTRDPEKKLVILQTLARKSGDAIPAAIVPFLEDPADDVRIEAAFALSRHRNEQVSREPLLKAIVASTDRNRVITAIADALVETGFSVQGYRDQVEPMLPADYSIEGDKVTKKA